MKMYLIINNWLVYLFFLSMLSACGGGGSSTNLGGGVLPEETYRIGGTVTGLIGDGLILQIKDGDKLPIQANGAFIFPAARNDNTSYVITVLSQPTSPSQTCTFPLSYKPYSSDQDIGVIKGADVKTVVVHCVTDTFAIGGTVKGLKGGSCLEPKNKNGLCLELQNNGTDDLKISADGDFNFATFIDDLSSYAVSVKTQPTMPNQTCAITNDSGTVSNNNVSNIAIRCITTKYKVGGTVTGLVSGVVTLQNNGADVLVLSPGDEFKFNAGVDDENAYHVTVIDTPAGYDCSVDSGVGIIHGADISNIKVACFERPILSAMPDIEGISLTWSAELNVNYNLFWSDKTGVLESGRARTGVFSPLRIKDMITAGVNHSCALGIAGYIVCWGDNRFGQTDVPALSNPTDVSAGNGHTCAIDDTGVHCWGDNTFGQIVLPTIFINPTQISAGNGYTCVMDDNGIQCWGDSANDKTIVPPLINPTQVSAGNGHTCAFDDTGIVCWGDNSSGQLTVTALDHPAQIATGAAHTCVLDDSGVKCWGWNIFGQTVVPVLSNPIQIAAGGHHTCALDDNGVKCWGNNSYGQLQVPALVNPTWVTAGVTNACALDVNGVKCWGNNSYGQLQLPALVNPTRVTAGFNHICALDDTGVVCWGNSQGGRTTVPDLINPRQVSAGSSHTCALDDTGVVCWGLEQQNDINIHAPKLINPVYVSSGGDSSCALDDTGVVCWGDKEFGQTVVPPLVKPGQVSAGDHICVLDNGNAKCWGENSYGQADDKLSLPGNLKSGSNYYFVLESVKQGGSARSEEVMVTFP